MTNNCIRDQWILVGSLRTGGAESAVRNLVANLPVDLKTRTRIWLVNDSHAAQHEQDLGVPVTNLDASNVWIAALRLRRHILVAPPTCLQAHLLQCIVCAGIALTGKPGRLLVFVHTFGQRKQAPKLMDRLRIGLERWVVRSRADRVIYVSCRIRQLHEQLLNYPEDKGLVVPNLLAGSSPASPPVRTGPLRWISVGRVETVKGFDWVINSKLIRSRLEREHWTIVGDGSQLAALRQAGADVVGLEFTGHRSDVSDLLAEHDVFILPSRSEGLSVALLEACRAGLPLIATRVGSNDEIIVDGMNGRLINVEDDQALDNALSELVDPDRRARWGRFSQRLFRARYDPKRLVDMLALEMTTGSNKPYGAY